MYHKLGGGGYLGQHAFSRDAFTWSSTLPCYNNSFPLEDGTFLVPSACGARARTRARANSHTRTRMREVARANSHARTRTRALARARTLARARARAP